MRTAPAVFMGLFLALAGCAPAEAERQRPVSAVEQAGRSELAFIETPRARAIVLELGAKVARGIDEQGRLKGSAKQASRGRIAVETQRDLYYVAAAALTSDAPETRRGRLERALAAVRGTQNDINRMLDRNSALITNLRQVSSDIAHDLRTPIAHLRQRHGAHGAARVEGGAIGEVQGVIEAKRT